MDTTGLPFTEQSDALTAELDSPDVAERIRILADSDRRLLSGIQGCQSLLDGATIATCVRAADVARRVLRSRRGRVVLAGAGTSGRLAFVVARYLDERLSRAGRRPSIHALIAGGPAALAASVEGAEDDLESGRRLVDRALPPGAQNLFVGITCGLSAPWVGGGLLAALAAEESSILLVGFNPIDRARAVFRPVAERVAASQRGMCLLPVLGPEPLAGSTRMKGGSATLLLLCSILEQAILDRRSQPEEDMRGRLLRFATAIEPFGDGRFQRELAALAAAAGSALLAGRTVLYLGSGLPGAIAVVDASECPPTFGADRRQVRAFVDGGYASLLPAARAGERFAAGPLEASWPADLAAWREKGPPPLPGDLVIQCTSEGSALRGSVATGEALDLRLGEGGDELTRLLRVKLALNAVSTSAFVTAGKVFGNRMIDLRISNTKLFERAVSTVAELARVDAPAAHRAVLGAIHRSDPGRDLLRQPVAFHVAAAARMERVVPVAVLMAGAGLARAEAEQCLAGEPLVRRALAAALARARP